VLLRPLPLLAVLACAAPPAPPLETHTVPPAPGIVVAKDLAAPEPPPGMRLPAGLRPLAQRVELTIVPSSDGFQGTTELNVELATPTDVVWLNAKKLTVERASARLGDAEIRAQVSLSPERVALRFPRALPPGRMTLRLAFSGTISGTEDAGIFHQQEGGDWYAMTQFEETDARRAFPCFDEPSVKIPWELTLVVPRQLLAVSNTPLASEEPAGAEMKRVRFAPTKPLPSYLVAFGVGPYDTVDARPAGMNKVPMRVYAPRGRASEAAYAVRTSPEILEALERYFGVPYPYQKLDLMVIPLTVHFGAMENAGLVTFASSRLLARPENESVKFQRIFAAIAAHEFAHQWFGDLVTLAWWDDIWLNESFATWAENKALDAWKPGWGIQMDDVRERSYAADRDTLISARQIRQPIESYDDISNAFDAITYQKGAAVLRMFETYVGEETFRNGVQRYLQTHAYGNATARDFVAAISEASGRDMWPPFDSFLDRPGVPQVTMRLSCAPGKAAELKLAQERLLPLGTKGTAASPWQVPVCVRWSSGGKARQACTLMTGPTASLSLGPGCPAWVLPNVAYAGYYRAKLEGGLLRDLVTRGRASLSAAETVGLLGDVEALVEAGRFPQGTGMELATRFVDAKERWVVLTAVDLAQVRAAFLEGAAAKAYPGWVRRHFGARARRLGVNARPGEDEETRLLRPGLIGFVAIRGQDAGLIDQARGVTEKWLQAPATVDADVVESALGIAGWFGDAKLHATLVERLKTSSDRATRVKLIGALAAFQNPDLVKANMALVETRPIDVRELGRLLVGRPSELTQPKGVPLSTREIIFQTVSTHFDQLTAALPERSAAYLFTTGAGFCDGAHRQAVEAAFGPRAEKALGGKRSLAQVLERIDLCIADRAYQLPSISTYLAGRATPPPSR